MWYETMRLLTEEQQPQNPNPNLPTLKRTGVGDVGGAHDAADQGGVYEP